MATSLAVRRDPHPEILVVEDDGAVRETLQELLEEEGYRVSPAANGREALERLRAGKKAPCLILLDLQMPVMDGWQFRKEMRGDAALAGIPVVVISADAGLERKVEGMAAAAVLPKPVELSRLLDTVHHFC